MCSIEEAWAGQNFEGKKVISQGDIHNEYISLPNNILNRGNEFMVGDPNQPQSRDLSRGLNSKYSREPRVSNNLHSTNNMDINISSSMPNTDKYMGVSPMSPYMDIYNNQNTKNSKNTHNTRNNQQNNLNSQQLYPQPISTGDNFTDIENAFNISDTLDNFMSKTNTTNYNEQLLNEDNDDDNMVINNKFNNLKLNNYPNNSTNNSPNNSPNNKNRFKNINSKNSKHNYDTSSDTENDNTFINISNSTDMNDSINNINNINIQTVLIDILNKLTKIENDLHHNNKKNMYDIILYILIGILLSFIIYSSVFAIKNN